MGNTLETDRMLMINLDTQNINDDLALSKMTLGLPENFLKMTEMAKSGLCY